jgi:hypothetical protein
MTGVYMFAKNVDISFLKIVVERHDASDYTSGSQFDGPVGQGANKFAILRGRRQDLEISDQTDSPSFIKDLALDE